MQKGVEFPPFGAVPVAQDGAGMAGQATGLLRLAGVGQSLQTGEKDAAEIADRRVRLCGCGSFDACHWLSRAAANSSHDAEGGAMAGEALMLRCESCRSAPARL